MSNEQISSGIQARTKLTPAAEKLRRQEILQRPGQGRIYGKRNLSLPLLRQLAYNSLASAVHSQSKAAGKALAFCFLLSALCFPARAAVTNVITTITITNAANITNGGARLIVTNADLSISVRTWTNNVFQSSTQILAGTTIAGDAQALLIHIAANRFTGLAVDGNAITYVRLSGTNGYRVAIVSNWASLTYSTQIFGLPSEVVSVPLDNTPHAVYTASQLEENLHRLSTNQYNKSISGTNILVVNTITGQVINANASVDTSGHVTFAGGAQFSGGIGLHGFVTQTNYTITTNDLYIGVITTNGPVTITLPLAAPSTNLQWTIKDEGGGAGTNAITVATQNADTLDGTNSYVLTNAFQSISILSRGVSNFVAFLGIVAAPTGGGGFDNVGSLDQAIYSPDLDKIFAVRGQYLYRFSAAGVYESAFRFASGVISDTSLCEFSNKLYVATWHGIRETNRTSIRTKRDIFEVDRTNFASVRPIGLPPLTQTIGNSSHDLQGFTSMIAAQTNLLAVENGLYICYIDPGDVTNNFADAQFTSYSAASDLSLDVTNQAVWAVLPLDGYVWVFGSTNVGTYFEGVRVTNCLGLAYCPSNTNVYGVAASSRLFKIDAASYYRQWPAVSRFTNNGTFSFVSMTNGGNSTLTNALPQRIKYRAYNDRLYIPTWEDDRVVRFCPTNDTVEAIFTGFDSPFDVVFTDRYGTNAGHAYAVQQSSVGLKLIE